ncbi:hypothetical protein [Paenibacillus sp. BR1-192]|uniref:hypothetical protein n=1 Tax=Paenibacillus sp. BR1-192 TaxID=3032287 RepID=UPI00240D25C3|nr:hypothetical protein [Paenibacillus sp. BR1-192]WFB59175.1 hypothetical protein P0X86_02730 [Paenibacillus sp. BR1-192]
MEISIRLISVSLSRASYHTKHAELKNYPNHAAASRNESADKGLDCNGIPAVVAR